jgi:hypothetical protein
LIAPAITLLALEFEGAFQVSASLVVVSNRMIALSARLNA